MLLGRLAEEWILRLAPYAKLKKPAWSPRHLTPLVGSRCVHVSCASCSNLKAIRRDKHRRQTVAKYENDRLHLRAIVRNNILPEVVQRKAKLDLANQARDASITRVRNRCVQTGRGRGVVTEFGLSRMKFRKLADFGMISGVTWSSW